MLLTTYRLYLITLWGCADLIRKNKEIGTSSQILLEFDIKEIWG